MSLPAECQWRLKRGCSGWQQASAGNPVGVGVLVEGPAEEGGDPAHQPRHGGVVVAAGRQRGLRGRRLPRQGDVPLPARAAVLLAQAARQVPVLPVSLAHHHRARRVQGLFLCSLQRGSGVIRW